MNKVKLLIWVAIAACFSAVQAADDDVIRLSEPVAVTDDAEIFGAPLNEDASPTSRPQSRRFASAKAAS
jgi:hypothetical protein